MRVSIHVLLLSAIISAPSLNADSIPIRVNAGGPAYTDSTGTVWYADSAYTGGFAFSTANQIANTTTPVLYQDQRADDGGFGYNFTVPNGSYTVKLKFAELYFSTPGQRVFDILLNGKVVTQNFDPIVAAGAPFTAIDQQYALTVSNGQSQI